MRENTLLPEVFDALAGHFAADQAGSLLPSEPAVSLEAVRHFLAERITALLDRNPGLLMSILYRIDVPERDVKRVFAEATPDALPAALADLMIERQLQKIRTRRAYRNDPDV